VEEETLGSLVAEATGALSTAGFNEPRRQARQVVAAALAISQTELFGHPDRPVDARQSNRFRVMLGRMVNREPLSRIVGRREFWGFEFALSTDTLDPRPETETLVEAVLKRKPDRHAPLRILDLGTGTGCLLLALLAEYPRAAGFGVDIAETAARTATRNAANLDLADRAHFFAGDWGAAISGRFDAIVANPPYIASADLALLPVEVARHDPQRALDGGRDGLARYREIATLLPDLLAPDGIFACEVGANQADPVAALVSAKGLILDSVDKDLCGIERCVIWRGQLNVDRLT
jgi:release factor glutamine methyltransferase